MGKQKIDFSKLSDSIEKKAEEIADAVEESANQLGTQIIAKKNAMDRERCNPIFIDEIESEDFQFPCLIHVVDQDKRTKISVCEGAVGFKDTVKGMNVLTLLREEISRISEERMPIFQPDNNSVFYYRHPVFTDKYLELDSYFDTIQAAKVGELREIASKLGAKKVIVTFREKKEIVTIKKVKAKIKGEETETFQAGAEGTYTAASQTKSSVRIGLNAEFAGRMFPERPILQYYKGDEVIEKLINTRMDRKNRMKTETMTLEQTKSIGISDAEAANIDAALTHFHYKGRLSISKEVKSRTNMVWEYTVF